MARNLTPDKGKNMQLTQMIEKPAKDVKQRLSKTQKKALTALAILDKKLGRLISNIALYEIVQKSYPFSIHQNNFRESIKTLAQNGYVRRFKSLSDNTLHYQITQKGLKMASDVKNR